MSSPPENPVTPAVASEHNRLHATLFHGAKLPMLLIDPKTGAIVDANPAAQKFYGYSLDVFLGKRISDINTLSAAEIKAEMQLAIEQKRECFHFPHRLANGEVRLVEVHSGPLHVGDRKVLYSIIQDVTERRRNDGQLRKLSIAVEQSPDSIVITDTAANIEYVNPRFSEVTGYRVDEVLGQNPRMLQSKLTPPETHRAMWHALTSGLAWRGEMINKRKDGTIYWEETHIAPVKDADGANTHYVGVKTDITRRKSLEQTLRSESAKNLALLRNASDGIHILDYGGNVVETSDSFCSMLGYSRDEVIGMNVSQWDAGFGDAEAQLLQVRRQFEKMARSQFETLHRRKDGSIFEVEVSGYPIVLDERPLLFNSSRDISDRKRAELLLENERTQLRTLLRTIPDLVWLKDTEGVYLACNHAFEKFFGASEAEIVGKTDHDFVEPELADLFRFNDQQALLAPSPRVNEEWVTFASDGRRALLEATKTAMRDSHGKVLGVLGISHDITKRNAAEAALRESEQLFRNMANSAPVLIWMSGPDMGCTWFNKKWIEFTGRTIEQEQGFGFASGVHADDYQHCFDTYTKAFAARQEFTIEFRLRRFDGEYRWQLDHATPRVDDQGQFLGYIGTLTDIHDRRQMEFEVQQLAFYDPLTRLPNRRLLNDRLQRTVSVSKRKGSYVALMMLDLDNFKPLNDSYGHAAGDLLLIEAAKRLKACVRDMDTVARMGGDEFVVLLGDLTKDKATSTQQAELVAQKILIELSRPYVLPLATEGDGDEKREIEHRCTASLGVMMFLGSDTAGDMALECADKAMYDAKEFGRNRVRFYQAAA